MMLLNEWQYQQYTNLLAVIKDVHGQRADDLCWMDIDRIFTAAGLPVPDRSVGDKDAMLKNCERFVRDHCIGKVSWQSYADLEAERNTYRDALREIARHSVCCNARHDAEKALNTEGEVV
jgi:hypothetical protein